jgi:large subunit ribosomal protein L6
MSRIGDKPIVVPAGVTVDLAGNKIGVKGPRGELDLVLPPVLSVEKSNGEVRVKRKADHKLAKSLHGLISRLIANMITGVSRGFEKRLEIIGVGYRAQMEGKQLVIQIGFSHPVRYSPLPGVNLRIEGNQVVVVEGCDKQKVGETAAQIRRFRPPEPYKGKGIRYQGEWVRRKAGKTIS